MTAQPNPPPLFSSNQKPSGLSSDGAPTRPFYWSVWRELWENHSIYVVPSIVAAIVLLASLAGSFRLPERRHNAMLLDPAHRRAAIEMPYDVVAMMFIVTMFIVGLFYCLDALYGERRDRSILFWKSLPVSDRTSVLSKASVPLVILPLVGFVVIVVTQFVMLLISTVALLPSGLAATSWANFNLFQQSLILLYGLVAIALWHAPIYGWALLVSGAAPRATFLWAVLPVISIQIFEKITFGTTYVTSFVQYRLAGFAPNAFNFAAQSHPTIDSLAQLTPGRYLSTPGLWGGLIFAAAFLAATVRLRRHRGPI